MDITMSRVHSASDTCDIYFTYAKVNHLLYTCSLDPFEDGILLDTPLVCMHRYCRNTTDDEEECKRQGTTTPSAREAWKRRRKKTELLKLQRPDIRAKGRTSGACAAAKELHQQTANSISGRTSGASPGHPAPRQSPDIRPFPRKSGIDDRTHPKFGHFSPDIRPEPRTSGASRSPRHPAPSLDIRRLSVHSERAKGPCIPLTYPFEAKAYIYPHLLLVRVSIGLAHILCESLSHPIGYFSL